MSVIGICKLCQSSDVELCDSHLLSKAAYKLIRKSQNGEAPIMMNSRIAISRDLQVRGHVFCRRCEDLLNKHGEAWVLRNCYRDEEGFALKDALDAAVPQHDAKDLRVYAAANILDIDVPRLAYFAGSVFWRSAAHEWTSGSSTPTRIRLGAKYENELRNYLLGAETFPKNATLWVNVVTEASLSGYFNFPYGGKQQEFWRYDFQFMGLVFTLFLGGLVPADVRRLCFVHSPEHYIAMSKTVDDLVFSHARKLLTKSKPVGSLKKWVEATYPAG